MADNKQTHIAPGSIQLETVELISKVPDIKIDLRPIILEINLFESLAQPFISGAILLTEALSLITTIPIVGEEQIHIKFWTPHTGFKKKIDLTFQIVAVEQMQGELTVRENCYIIRIVSPEAVMDWTHRIRKSYADMSLDQAAKKLFDQYLKVDTELTTSPASGTNTIVIPNMHPSEALRFIAKQAKSDQYAPSNFVFFQNADGFFFKTLDELIDQPRADRYIIGHKDNSGQTPLIESLKTSTPTTREETTLLEVQRESVGTTPSSGNTDTSTNQNIKPEDFQMMNDYVFPQMFNIRDVILKGGYDNKVFVLNPATNIFEQRMYNYLNDWTSFKHTHDKKDGKLIWTDGMYGSLSGDSHHRMIMSDIGEESSELDPAESFTHLMAASVALLDYVQVHVTIPGASDRRAGDVIALDFPEWGATDDMLGRLNKFVSGDYLVTAVRQLYSSSGSYSTVLECVKNAFEDDPESHYEAEDLKSSSDNLKPQIKFQEPEITKT